MSNNGQNEIVLPAGDSGKRKTSDLLPRFFRTAANVNFLQATLDQLVQPGVAEKLSGYFGRKTAKSFDNSTDNYIGDVSKSREDYQFEPATVIKDNLKNVSFYADYNDYINQANAFGASTKNHSKFNSQESYPWNPNIDWDKFVNFREYYWLPNGPQSIPVRGQSLDVQSTYTVTLEEDDDNFAYVFSPNGFTRNPTLKLYRGQTYRFEIDTPGHPIAFAISRSFTPGAAVITAGREGVRGEGLFDATLYGNEYDQGDFIVLPDSGSITFEDDENVSTIYPDGIRKLGEAGEEIATVYVEKGTIEFTVPLNAPENLYYISKNDVNTSGQFRIFDIEENTFIDVEAEILGKKEYISENGIKFSNGMKVYFQGNVTPEKYSQNEWYIEGVGDKIKLIKDQDLVIPASYAENILVPFDSQPFDRLPFSNSSSYPATKDYIVSNRASLDRNAWSRYNRWFHKDVIETSATVNGTASNLDQEARAKRPIIEFESGLKLYNFGTQAKQDVDLVDDFTKDVFSIIEGSVGYNVDGVDLAPGMRVLFTADTDILVKNKIYEVKFITVGKGQNARRQISLIEASDTDPQDLETVLVTQGETYAGQSFYYENGTWSLGQQKTKNNQPILFDLCCPRGNFYGNTNVFDSSTFNGTKVFSYKEGTGSIDEELGFPLSYKNIENSGDIVFEFNLLTDSFTIQTETGVQTVNTDNAYLRKYADRENFAYVNGWSSTPVQTKQYVLRQYTTSRSLRNNFNIDMFDKAGDLNDLRVIVFLNNQLQKNLVDYEIDRINGKALVRFYNDLAPNNNVLIKADSSADKNSNGYYEFPHNLERNPLNQNINEFTLGEVIDHVDSMVEELRNFDGVYPGPSNLRDLGDLDRFGKRFIKHSGPINLSSYHIVNNEYNIVSAMRHAKSEYAKFKRIFIQTATDLGYNGPIKQHVDQVFFEINKDKVPTMPYYFSDMVPVGPSKRLEYEVLDPDNPFYALTETFTLNELSSKSVLVYLNGNLLLHGTDYTFDNEGFGLIVAGQKEGDIIEIYEYENTDGSYVPPTPTKLGLYPAYEPKIYVDDTYREPTKVIQGHDGSLVVAFNDYRDELILEFERRIYNNIKQQYDTSLFDINDFVPSFYRNTSFTFDDINAILLTDFTQWQQLVDLDYTENSFYARTEQFTYNYSSMNGPNGEKIPGFWRGVYRQAYDTDRPHTHPWEMLGFTIKPKWWEEVYGPAPYTSNNLILWEDLEEGAIREPNQLLRRNPKYARPGLTNHIPVDKDGNLISPLESNYAKNYIASYTRNKFAFGDQSPVENAWRKSSEYPFAIMIAYLLSQPSKVIGTAFDISRITRNFAGQLIYLETGKQIEPMSLVFPNTYESNTRIQTSGLVNYMYNFIAGNVTRVYDDYQTKVKSIKNQIGVKIAGFTDKSKFKLLLDSRTPYNQGNVFVPEENYQIFLNTSAPVDTATYGAVVVEKAANGFAIKGYSFDRPYFDYYPVLDSATDPVIEVGGVSEPFVIWAADKRIYDEQVVEYEGNYYRATDTFTTGESFSTTNLARLPELPVVGGKRAFKRSRFNKRNVQRINYGTIFTTSQEVVDFLLGYGEYLIDQGFEFDTFDEEVLYVKNWEYSAREFLFWTTQNWALGTAVSLSPAAELLKFQRDYTTPDNIFSYFNNFGLVLNADGRQVAVEYNHIIREDNALGILLKNTNEGIYHLKIPLVQKEHVVLLDNVTEFNDVVYQPSTGYRQDRIKVLGYRTDEWNGTLNAPGFIYDDAKIVEWEPWTDYKIGQLIKYKEFYYVSLVNVPGSQSFDSNNWQLLSDKPESDLLANFDYKSAQFADFYDLDSDNFDIEQQKLAQHLIGYQNRDYLANIINDDVSQYKFYQGFIQDKGTKNAIEKLFDALNSADKDSLEFYEEWAIQKGLYGATNKTEELEVVLKEEDFVLDPQPVELVDQLPADLTDRVYRQRPFEIYLKPDNYTSTPFPQESIKNEFVKTSGYVLDDEVNIKAVRKDDLKFLATENLNNGDYVWVVVDDRTWNVYQYTATSLKLNGISIATTETVPDVDAQTGLARLTFNKFLPSNITKGTFIAVPNAEEYGLANLLKVVYIERNEVLIEIPASSDLPSEVDVDHGIELSLPVTFLRKVRVADINEANEVLQDLKFLNQKLWVDDIDGKWSLLENKSVYNYLTLLSNPTENDSTLHNFGNEIDVTSNNRIMAVGSSGELDGRVRVYRRSVETNNWQIDQEIIPPEEISQQEDSSAGFEIEFGKSLAFSPDGEYLAIGVPNASNIRTRYTGDFNSDKLYNKNDIVKYKESFWRANRQVLPQSPGQPFNTFSSYLDIISEEDADSTLVNLLLTGNPGLPNYTDEVGNPATDHFLVRAPVEQYLATSVGDQVAIAWNIYSRTNPTIDAYLPWNGDAGIGVDDITATHTIMNKIDEIFFVSTYISVPSIGDRITTLTGSARVVYTAIQDDNLVIYVNDVNGTFDLTGPLFANDEELIGNYSIEATNNLVEGLGGFWMFSLPDYDNGSTWYDVGKGLIYNDVKLADETRDIFKYFNILNNVLSVGDYEGRRKQSSQIINLTYQGDPGGVPGIYSSNLYVVRGPDPFRDNVFVGDKFQFLLYNLPNYEIDVEAAGFTFDLLNKEQTVYDIWNGFIEFEYSEFVNDLPFEIEVGDIIVDNQIPFDEFGGLSLSSFTTSSAEVVYYQRDFNNVRVYVKNVTGDWNYRSDNIARFEIIRKGNEDLRGPGDPDRVTGVIDDPDASVSLPNSQFRIGNLFVFEAPENLPLVDTPEIIDEEYWFFDNKLTEGAFREANPPFTENKDYTQIFNIPVDIFGEKKYDNEGVISVFRKDAQNKYVLVKNYVSQQRGNNRYFGQQLKFTQNEFDYTLYVTSAGNSEVDNRGTIEFFKHGFTPEKQLLYRGFWNIESNYVRGNIVKHLGLFYEATTDIQGGLQNSIDIYDTAYWRDISFKYSIDENYRGLHDSSLSYVEGELVKYKAPDSTSERLYRALTNISADSPFNDNHWERITDGIDYLGYLPNDTGTQLFDYVTFDKDSTYSKGDLVEYNNQVYVSNVEIIPDTIEENRRFNTTEWTLLVEAKDEVIFDPATDIIQYGEKFDVSDNGSVLIIASKQQTDSTPETVVLVYRQINNKYYLDQVINPDMPNTGFAHSISLSSDGLTLVISEPFDDTVKTDQGKVHVYRQENGSFKRYQTLYSPNNEEAEKFGFTVFAENDYVAITSIAGDTKLPTTFDNGNTTFDSNYTMFNNILFDSGVVYIYEKLFDKYLYAEEFKYNNVDTFFLGENLLIKNNHVYLGMPKLKNDQGNQGIILDYRKTPYSKAWEITKQEEVPVDVSKIEKIFLYNKKTNEFLTYLDCVDIVQGKLPGPADQELTYKTPYDPALYNNTRVESVYDARNSWGPEHVGELWWDISEARYPYPYQGNILERANKINNFIINTKIDVYEWVESDVIPSEWDAVADTEEGTREGKSGLSIYSDAIYSIRQTYDPATQTFGSKYYFWVRNKSILPSKDSRAISSLEVTQLLSDPSGQGYRHITFTGGNKFVVHNCQGLLNNDDIVLNIQWQSGVDKEQNIHTEYQIMSEGLESSKLSSKIERKWFDSLIGFDSNFNVVPDPNLSPKQRYGNKFRPRQSMFVNREEALKQVIERINSVLKENIIIDLYDISSLQTSQDFPKQSENAYDAEIDTLDELRFVGTAKIIPAEISVDVDNGKIIRANIINSGRGYKVPPSFEIKGTGNGAELELTINNLGQVTNVEVVSTGSNYNENTSVIVRPFSVLVKSDNTVYNKWSIYRWNNETSDWFRFKVQEFDVSLFWDYEDWYENNINEFTSIDYTVDESYELQSLDDEIGNIVKINNIGSGGWLLLRKIANVDTEDYTINYETIGRQNGTIQFKDSLYDLLGNSIGYDNRTYDSYFYDSQPIRETRIILETIRDNIFVGDLAVEYNNLWFASLRYVFAEQSYVDWAFKTSFIKATHNLGLLDQPATFKNNTLPSYAKYVNEAKPFSTNVREFVSSHEAFDNTNSLTTDFDLPPAYDDIQKKIVSNTAIVLDNTIFGESNNTNEYPRKSWLDNVGYGVESIQVANPGSGYTFKPRVIIEGGGGSGAVAEAYIGQGSITEIKVVNPGKGYLSQPTIRIEGSQTDGGVPATASIILGNNVVRSTKVKVKFDRLSGELFITNLKHTQTFQGTGSKFIYNLEWPMDLKNARVKVFVNGKQALRSEYQFTNEQDTSKGYTRLQGQIEFTDPPANNSEIVVEYYKPLSMLTARERIEYGYEANSGMLGKDPAQLMNGVDYGGVEVRSFEFDGPSGWDSDPWYTAAWDTYDDTFEDEIFTFDGSTISVQLVQPLEQDVVYNVYLNGTRIDDPNFDTGTPSNADAIINSIVGDGTTQEIFLDELGISVSDGDKLIIRKVSSDGSFLPSPDSYDTALSGGDLAYQSAQGINAEDIIVDGDGFVTPITSGGPEEIVPGQVVDTLDIKVYHRDSAGQGVIYTQSYITDGSKDFDLGVIPGTSDSVLVKIDNIILNDTEYSIDWKENIITLSETPEIGKELNVVTVSKSGQNILDLSEFRGDGETVDFTTKITFIENMTAYTSINGQQVESIVIEGDDSTNTGKVAVIRFSTPPELDSVIRYSLFAPGNQINYSTMTKDTFVADGCTTVYELTEEPIYKEPTSYNTVVKVGNKILNPGYNKQFVIQTATQSVAEVAENPDDLFGTVQYALDLFQQPSATLQVESIKVYLNGEQLTFPNQWRFDIFNSAIELLPGIGEVGDIIEVYVEGDGEYNISGKEIQFLTPPEDQSVIEVYRFNNHDILEIERISYDIVARSTLTQGTDEYVIYHRLTKGEITLRYPAIAAQYVWVSVNGELLSPAVDYSVSEDKMKVKIKKKLSQNDVVDIIHFSAPQAVESFGYRQFKDMLNRTHYKRLDGAATVLAQDLNYYDLRIEVKNGDELPEPNKGKNLPGIIFINGERIEYLVKDGNSLRQLRRGTLGTGTPIVHPAESNVIDQSVLKTVPYQDETIVKNYEGDGTSVTFPLDFNTAEMDLRYGSAKDLVEVFYTGRRLRKDPIEKFNVDLALDSPEGDETIPAEFSIDNDTLTLTIIDPETGETIIPNPGERITIIRRVGKYWTDNGESLVTAENDIANFLRSGSTDLLE